MTLMTEETVALEQTQNAPDPTKTAPEVVAPEAEANAQANEQQAEPSKDDDAEKARRAMQRRIDKRTADLYRERAQNEQLSQRIAAMEARLNGQPENQQTQQDIDPAALAREIAAVERVTEKANRIADDGEKQFKGEFRAAINAVVEEAGPLFDQRGRATPVGEAILDADEPAKLLHYLGQNPDLAAELHGLSPAQLGRRIGKIEAQMNAKPTPKPVSRAPDPARPIAATRSGSNNLADMSMEEYVAARRAQGARWAR